MDPTHSRPPRRGTTRLARIVPAAALAAAGLAALPVAPAHAATSVTFVDGVLTVTATTAEDIHVTDTTDFDGQPVTSISFGAATTVPGCDDVFGGGSTWYCTGVSRLVFHGSPAGDAWLALGVRSVPQELHGGDGSDALTSGDGDDRIFGEEGDDELSGYGGTDLVDGGDGDEYFLFGGDGQDTVTGGAGNDRPLGGADDDVVSGGPGNDEVLGDSIYYDDDGIDTDGSGRDGDDTLRGDDGHDVLLPSFGTDVVHGGPGEDTVSYDGMQEDGVDFAVSLDRTANDGIAGEADNIGPAGDVENIEGPGWSTASTVLTGSAGPNEIVESGLAEALEVDGGAGDDLIDAGSFTDRAPIVLIGGDGDDTIDGYGDTAAVDAGAGADTIETGSGNDLVLPGPGPDIVDTGDGNDQLDTLDGERDLVGCGVGGDAAVVDHVDIVDADPGSLCETVTVPRPDASVTVARSVNLSATGRSAFPLANDSAFPVSAKLVAKTTKGKSLTLGKGSGRVAAESSGEVGFKLTRKGKKVVRKAKKVPAKLTFTITGNGQTVKVTRKVSLKK